jgi:hypothetical protein
MLQAVRRLFAQSIDYAGEFPPARLDAAAAIREYEAIGRSHDAWILSRYACLARSLPTLAERLRQEHGLAIVPLTVIGSPGASGAEWDTARESDAGLMNRFLLDVGDLAAILGYEVAAPPDRPIDTCLAELDGFGGIDLFIELRLDEHLEDAIVALAESEIGSAKARTGGVEPGSVPSAAALAHFMHQTISLEVPFKLTAGLHDPFATKRGHGFVNVFGAAVLALAHELSERETEQILADGSPTSWSFSEAGVRWRDISATLDEIEDGRQMLRSFGSCSIAEPLHGLRETGLLETSTIA